MTPIKNHQYRYCQLCGKRVRWWQSVLVDEKYIFNDKEVYFYDLYYHKKCYVSSQFSDKQS